MVKAYCIEEEGRYKESNFAAIVPDVVRKGDVDILVLQTGSIELTNIDVNKAIDDKSKDINEYKKEWYIKAEKDSENLFSIAESAIAHSPELNVVIVKRLPRFDHISRVPLGIKSQLSKFANYVYDQLWLKRGSPARIHVVDFNIECKNGSYLKDMLYGKPNNQKFDGTHLIGGAAFHLSGSPGNEAKNH